MGIASCSKCFAPLPVSLLNRPDPAPCPACRTVHLTCVFPAFLRAPVRSETGETIITEGEASCFYHPSKRAVRPCDQCGRFLCSLCDLDLQGKHLCPNCLSSPQKRQIVPQLENRRVLYDSTALTLALLPLLALPITVVTAPIALVMAIYSFKKESSLIPRTRARSWFALLFAGAEIAGWIFIFAAKPMF